MSRNVIASLNEWKRNRPVVDEWKQVRISEQEVHPFEKPPRTETLREMACGEWKDLLGLFSTLEEDWRPQPTPRIPESVIPCHIVELSEGHEAVCAMIADGYEIPRVSFPACILRQKGLQVGSRFNWLVRDPGRVELSDIDTRVPQADEVATVDLARLEALHAEMELGLAEDGGKWPIYTGDGD